MWKGIQFAHILSLLKVTTFSVLKCLSVCNSLRPYEMQHARLPWPPPAHRAYSNSCALSRLCHPKISFSVVPFTSCRQSFPASGSYTSDGQSIDWRASASTSVLRIYTQDWFPLQLMGFMSLQSKGLSMSSPTPQFKSINSSDLSFFLKFNSHIHTWRLKKPQLWLDKSLLTK